MLVLLQSHWHAMFVAVSLLAAPLPAVLPAVPLPVSAVALALAPPRVSRRQPPVLRLVLIVAMASKHVCASNAGTKRLPAMAFKCLLCQCAFVFKFS